MDAQSNVGQYTHRTTCRCCEGSNLVKIMDFGNMPLAGGFLKQEDFADEKVFPLEVDFCNDCTLVQVPQVIPPEVLFKNYFYFSSSIKTLVDHCSAWAQETFDRFLQGRPDPSVFEIGCNDGVMLKPYAALGVRAVGVDPATNVVQSVAQEGFTIVNDFFNEDVAKRIREEHGQFDIVTSSYSFAHIDDMVSVGNGVAHLLKDDGVFVFEVYYLGTLIDEMQYDMIYHEHCNYYSLKALQHFLGLHGMEIFETKFTPGVRSGAVRFYARKIGGRPEPIAESVHEMEQYEITKGFGKSETFTSYGEKVRETKEALMQLLVDVKAQGKRIIGYGASGRGTMIMNYCGIDGRYLDYVVDDAPAKHGFYTPGTHVVIQPWEHVVQNERPDFALLFAWSFADEVLKKRTDYVAAGGKFIVPLPTVKVIP
ncbi:MAG: class I SAM-dependent methyltransferase [bacterium]|nr:class I SAM-dependent methyltransferase [bacterium]